MSRTNLERIPLVVRARELVAEAEMLLRDRDVASATVDYWTVRARGVIKELFGEDSPQVAACLPVVENVPKHPRQRYPHKSFGEHNRVRQRLSILIQIARTLDAIGVSNKIFVGHGRSLEWLKLRDFLKTLGLPAEEFNVEPMPGIATSERLQQMLSSATLAFLLMTGEDELSDGSLQSRQNVVHEIGLFQGRLGSRRAIVLVEDGCRSFSNLDGLTTIRFPRGDVSARLDDVRAVLVWCAALLCTYVEAATKAALARVTLARMSEALAVQMKGFGSRLC